MVGGDRTRRIVTIAAGAVTLATVLGACASGGGAEQSQNISSALGDVTLAQSKSYAQLLRNEASSRLPEIILKEVSETTDVSVACEDESADPEGLARSWSSTTSILITNSTAARVQSVSEDLIATFVDQGWTSTLAEESTDTLTIADLRNDSSLAWIQIATASKSDGQVPSIVITARGACAMTEGPLSDEVVLLEGQDAATAG
jgi:hypothetical protein